MSIAPVVESLPPEVNNTNKLTVETETETKTEERHGNFEKEISGISPSTNLHGSIYSVVAGNFTLGSYKWKVSRNIFGLQKSNEK